MKETNKETYSSYGKYKANDLSNVKFTNNDQTSLDRYSGASTQTKEDIVPTVSFTTLFRFANGKHKCYIFLSLLFSMVAGATTPINTLLFAFLLQSMVDFGISAIMGTPDTETFMSAVETFALYNTIVGVIVVILSYGSTALSNIAAYEQIFKIRQEYLKAAMNQDFAYFDTHQTGDFASKMSEDVIKLEDGIGEKLATFVFYQSTFISSVIMAIVKGWKLALLCLITFPVTLLLVGVAGLVAAKMSKKELTAMGLAGNVAEEVLSTIRTVYAFSGQQKEIERYQVHLEDARKLNIKKAFFSGIAMGTLFFCIFCAYALSFWFGYRLMRDEPDNYDVQTMIAVFFGVLMGSANFGISSTLMEAFGIARGAGAQIFHLIDQVPSINPQLNLGVTPDNIDGNIELRNVDFHYPSRPDVPILKGVSLSVKRGQSVALVGHSGSGKSTIIQLICRYYDVIDGSVCIDGQNVQDLSVRWVRSQIGLVGQEPVLFNTTVRSNIRYGREDATDAEIEAVARQANAHHFIMKLPKGYDTMVGERGASLSGGQKQRIAIARALIRDPRILLLDEATSALDTASEDKVQRALDKAHQGRTTIIVAHRLSTIRNVDMIYVFKSGEIVESGNHEELLKKKGHYFDMVTLQTFPDDLKQGKENEKKYGRASVVSEIDNEEVPMQEIANDAEEAVPEASFRRVIKLNAPEWKTITVASLCSLINGFGMPMLAVILGDFIGTLSNPNQDEVLAEVKRYVYIFVGIGLVSGLMSFIQVFLYGIAGEYLTERLRRTMFCKLLHQEVGFYDDRNNSTGALCARLSGEAAAVQGATGQRIGTVLQAVGTFSFSLVLALIYEWRVGLVALTFVPIMGAIVYKQGRMVTQESSGTAKTMEASSKIAVEAVSNIRTVASLGREELFQKEYAQQLVPAIRLASRSAHWRGVVFGLSRGVFNFVYAAALYYGGVIIVRDGVGYDTVLKSAQALLMGASSSAQAFAFAPNFQKGINAAGRILVLLNRESKITDPDKPVKNFRGTGQASLQKVEFKFPTRPTIQVLKGLDLEIDQGKTIALVGASGCGKSTVIQLLERYYDPNDGVVAQDGTPLVNLLLSDARQTIGFVQQEPILFDRTISENIAYGDNNREPSMEEIIEAAKEANIHNFITSLPMGYDTNIGSKGTLLSGGQKQRVAIARALIRKPKLLLLDEATSALDTASEKVVQEALDKAKAGRTCVTIAHRLSTIRDADVIAVVHEGQIAESGTHAELMNAKGRYYALNQRGYS